MIASPPQNGHGFSSPSGVSGAITSGQSGWRLSHMEPVLKSV